MILLLTLVLAYSLPAFVYALWQVSKATYITFQSYQIGVRLVLKWFALLWIGLSLEVFVLLFGWIFILFANHETGRMPYGFRWMETHDALLPGYPIEQGFNIPCPTTWWDYYWQSVCWLYRNRAYRFAAEVMGVKVQSTDTHYHYGDFETSDEPPVKYGQFVEVTHNCFEVHKVFPLFGRNWEWRIGYKLAWTIGQTTYAQHVLRLRSGSKRSKVNGN